MGRLRRVAVLTTTLMMVAGISIVPVSAAELGPGGTFQDDNGHAAEGYIEAIAAIGVTNGCDVDIFCPNDNMTRAQMASFMVRAFDIAPTGDDYFSDDNGTTHEASINALAASGITYGCADGTFCPQDLVTRGQLASFLVRTLGLEPGDTDLYPTDPVSNHDASIGALVAAGIAEGCSDTSFCPTHHAPRWVMAANLARALGLDPIEAPAPLHPLPPEVGDGKRIIYANADQRVWLIDERNVVVDSYLVSGRAFTPGPGTYSVFSKSEHAFAYNGITMDWMVRFTWGRTLAIGFHGIPRYADGTPMQTLDQLGTFQSHGCVRQDDVKAEALFHWAEIGTTVHVTA